MVDRGSRVALQAALSDRYTLEREIGRGGMATVYLARDLRHGRPVALKVLHPELAATLGPDRFVQEIRTAAGLQHPHLLPVFDSGEARAPESGSGQLWYTMPYVEGETLRQRLSRERQLPIDESLRIASQVLSALHYAHSHGVVHRDIKPENILLQGDQAVVADLGIARAIGAAGEQHLTETGLTVGTPAYMSPEQAAGDRELDGRSDVYSVGTVLYEMLAGEPPFTGHSAQAIIARRLTESPPPLHALRETVSPELEAVIMKALARAPADRYGTAAAFAGALVAIQGGRPRVRRTGWNARRLIAGIAGVLLVLVIAGVVRSRAKTRTTLDESLLVVAPFDVLDPKLGLWREGLVDLLSRNLDGAGPLRTVSPTVVVRRWAGRADPQSAGQLGHRTGAGLALYGSLLASGSDSVRVQATLLDVARGNTLEEWQLRDQVDRVDRLTDSLTLRVLEGLGRSRPIGSVRLVGLGSTSLPALKAFLQGEQHLRRSEWDSALVSYERAIRFDSAFAPALRRAGTALGWIRTGTDSLANAFALRAGEHNHGLPLRDSLLITVDSVFASLLNAGPLAFGADSLWGPRLHRLFAMTKQLTDRYPQDPEAWYSQGEADNHMGPFAERTAQDQLDAFDRAIALDSAFAPAYIHAIEVSGRFGPEANRKYLGSFLRLTQGDQNANGARLLAMLLDSMPPKSDRLRLYGNFRGDGLFATYSALSTIPDSAELGVEVSGYIAEHLLPRPPFNDPEIARRSYARALMSRGHLAAGFQQLPDGDQSPMFAEAALLGGVPPSIASQRFSERMANPSALLVPAYPLWSSQGNTGLLRLAARRADSIGQRSPDPTQRSRARYARLAAAAYLELSAKDTTRALQSFQALPRDLCPACYLDRLMLAQLLLERRQDQEAMRILRVDHPSFSLNPTPTAILWVLLRGRVAERMNQRDLAMQSYSWVSGMWRNADAVLQPYVVEAREGLTRLTGERR